MNGKLDKTTNNSQQVQRLSPDTDIHLVHLRQNQVLVLVQTTRTDQGKAGHRFQAEVPLVLLLGGNEVSEETARCAHVLFRAELVDVDAHVEGLEEDLR